MNYPLHKSLKTIHSLSLDKTPSIDGILWGIKGQYLQLDTGVINIRRHTGYEVEFLYD